jgi:prepilin-type N-terminal cleavage/methylation domain-containing protein
MAGGTPALPAGFTLAEVLIAIVVTSLVMVAVAGLFYSSARTLKEVDEQARMRTARMTAIDALKYRLMDARIGSCLVSESNRRIQFRDPNLGGVVSAFFFNADSNTLFYDDDIDDGVVAVEAARGPIDITFEVQNTGTIVVIKVTTVSDLAYANVDTQDGATAVYLRN